MKIYIVRHFQTNMNEKKVMQGLTDEPLSKQGMVNAIEAGIKLKKIKFDAIYSSPSQRCVKTAELLTGLDSSGFVIDNRLTEVDFGPYEGKSYKRLGIMMILYWLNPLKYVSPNGVECAGSVILRCNKFLEELFSKNYNQVLIVSHGNTIRALQYIIEGKLHHKKHKMLGNGEMVVYEILPKEM